MLLDGKKNRQAGAALLGRGHTREGKASLVPYENEMTFLYGNHIPKAGLGRMTEGGPQYAGVVVFNMSNVPLGFGIASHATEICRTLPPTSHVVLHQADVGEYLRQEDTLNDNVSSFANN